MSYIRFLTYLFFLVVGLVAARRVGASEPLVILIGGIVIGNTLFDLLDELLEGFARSEVFKSLTNLFDMNDEDEQPK